MYLMASFDGQKTWVMFFLLFGLELLGEKESYIDNLDEDTKNSICDFFETFMTQEGIFSPP